MKNLVEYMTTMIITMVLIFVFSGIISVSMQITNAHSLFNEVFNKYEASFYQTDLNDVNSRINDDWYFETKEIESVKTRKTVELSLFYTIKMPLLGGREIKSCIRGYAR